MVTVGTLLHWNDLRLKKEKIHPRPHFQLVQAISEIDHDFRNDLKLGKIRLKLTVDTFIQMLLTSTFLDGEHLHIIIHSILTYFSCFFSNQEEAMGCGVFSKPIAYHLHFYGTHSDWLLIK